MYAPAHPPFWHIYVHFQYDGLSNVMLEDECEITVEDGYLLVIRNLNI